jgi:hypothetical protein
LKNLSNNRNGFVDEDALTKEQPFEIQKNEIQNEGICVEKTTKVETEPKEDEYISFEDDDDEDDKDTLNIERERYYTVDDYVKTFAKHSIMKNYLLILEDYQTNNGLLNHYIVKMFRRLHNLKYTLLFYQVRSVFFEYDIFQRLLTFLTISLSLSQIFALRIFNQIITDKSIQDQKSDPSLIELRNFALEIIKSFLQVLAQNPLLVAQEVLGRRTKREAELALVFVSIKAK